MSFSRLYFDGADFRQVMSTKYGIIGIIIPASREESPSIIKLSDFQLYPTVYGLGLHKGHAVELNEHRFGYSWVSDPEDVYHNGEITGKKGFHYRSPTSDHFSFDEELGRLASIVEEEDITVVDFPI